MNPDIFIVDDDRAVARALDRLLQTAGYSRRVFTSASEAIEALRESTPRCLLIDVHMPGRNGIDLFRTQREEWPQIPVVFMSGHLEMAAVIGNIPGGPHRFLAKPFEADDLLKAIDDAIASRAG
jgi:FixJ family two-component response regulator